MRARSASAPVRSSRLQGVGTGHAQMRQGSRPAVPDDAAVVDDLLKLGGGFFALSGGQVCLTANVRRIKAGKIGDETDCPSSAGEEQLAA